ncbi:hypothetical protein HPP92_020126 [Vanilla planifolia]|uniref:Pre-mRNA polyadenylation factor Fip1 domain-containing protein n=1 Tax=Vanilla planifolia TaxID=51239 RepID=A0A835QB14_VANPL|nr:hypothetical protein HPP92_020126 [Vanilla planifolia]
MEEDDDFGDLYTDVLSATPVSGPPLINQNTLAAASKTDADEEGKAVYEAYRPSAPTSEPFIAEKESKAASTEDANDDWLLGRDPLPVVEPANWVDEEEEIVSNAARDAVGGIPARGDMPRVLEKEKEETASRVSQEEIGDALRGKGFPDKTDEIGDLDVEPVIPGLSSVLSPSGVPNGELAKPSGSDYWDSDSDDDLQIVLNESGNDLKGMVGRDDREGEDEDEDEDLVILTDEDQHHHHQAMEDQDWGSDVMQLSADGEKKEMLEGVKTGALATTGSGSRIGYSNHIFHSQHHSMYKYVRPGAPPTPGGPCTTAAGTTSQVRPAVSGPMVGRGRGDWRPVGGKGYPHMQKGFHSGYGLPAWGNNSSGRPFGIGLDFTLPSHKTVFDIDIESFEEKPWRYPGVDISDFFNFGLDEENWKEYCKQVEQIRLESTMQSKIRVYESGRSEQDYDPDLPPELAAATGTADISTDNTNYGKSDNLQADLSGQGRGSVCVWPPLPTGRAIQVEGGYGERLPSIDTRPPRIRDADSVIEIVLQDNLDGSTISNGVFEQSENNFKRKSLSDFHDVDEDGRPTGSDSHGHLSCTSNGQRQQRESMTRRIPGSLQGDGILPFPSDLSLQYNNSKSRSPIDTARSVAMQHGGRVAQRSSRGMKSTSEGSNEALFSESMHLDKHDEDNEQAKCVMEGNQGPRIVTF